MSDAPKRVQLSRAKGWRKPEDAIVVARPTRWGNPYRVVVGAAGEDRRCGWRVKIDPDDEVVAGPFESRLEASKVAVELYAALDAVVLGRMVAELRGHDLACWCPLVDDDGKPWPCHADVLLALSNR